MSAISTKCFRRYEIEMKNSSISFESNAFIDDLFI
jgi:hypothetical protein